MHNSEYQKQTEVGKRRAVDGREIDEGGDDANGGAQIGYEAKDAGHHACNNGVGKVD